MTGRVASSSGFSPAFWRGTVKWRTVGVVTLFAGAILAVVVGAGRRSRAHSLPYISVGTRLSSNC